MERDLDAPGRGYSTQSYVKALRKGLFRSAPHQGVEVVSAGFHSYDILFQHYQTMIG
jgi:hypothetical protein